MMTLSSPPDRRHSLEVTMTQLHRGPYHGPILGWSGLVISVICFLAVAGVIYIVIPPGVALAVAGSAVALYAAFRIHWRHE